MTPRQKEVAWALGVIFFVIGLCGWIQTGNDYWGIITLGIISPWFIYTGGREMFDSKYRRDMAIWSEKIAAQADNKPFNEKEAGEKVDKYWKQYGWASGNYWAARGTFMGVILLMILIGLISKHF